MSDTILFSFLGNEDLTRNLARNLKMPLGEVQFRKFPDGESYVRILTEVKHKNVVLVCTLHQPDDKFLSLYFFCKIARTLQAKNVLLVAPYLSYMRQDKTFNPGEGITSKYFGDLISESIDGLVTVDPHLHRFKSLSSIYAVPSIVLRAAEEISRWVKQNVRDPFLIGPDEESKPWISQVAKNANAPFIILNKIRYGDRNVKVSWPDLEAFKNKTPVLVDDIISTAGTMIETIKHLKNSEMKNVVVIGIHAIFAGDAYQNLMDSGVGQLVTCDTIPHTTNAIDLSNLLGKGIEQLLQRIT